MQLEIGSLLSLLDEREKIIINSRFGLNERRPETLEEVSRKFGVTRERIRQLQNIALEKLRRALQKKEKLSEYREVGHFNSIPEAMTARG